MTTFEDGFRAGLEAALREIEKMTLNHERWCRMCASDGIGQSCSCGAEEHNDGVDALSAAIRALPVPEAPAVQSAGVRVKKLEWQAIGHEDDQHIICYSLLGTYVVVKTEWWIRQTANVSNECSSFDEAKAAAQADYERRIMSAVEADIPAAKKGGVS